MNLPLEEISNAVGGVLQGAGGAVACGYSIDSRTLKPGELFFAIRGPRFDGHRFVQESAAGKACGAVVEEEIGDLPGNFGIIRVKSTIGALQALATDVRRRWGAPVIGVTGSAGKTTTKEMIAAVLGKQFTVLRSVGNLNNEFGLPLCLLRAERHQNIGVLEMGMSAKGEIRRLAAIAEPNEGVITNVNPVHLEFFKSVDEIAEAKAELLEGLVAPRLGYFNSDDSRVRAMARKFDGRIVTYAVESDATFKVREIQDLGLDGTAFTVCHGGRDVNFELPLLGRHNVTNALAAIAVGATHDLPWDKIREAVSELKPEKMRGEVIRFREDFVVIDDSYNSNPKALTEMIRFVGSLQGCGPRKIVVAGEMLELGPESADLHRACGREAAHAGIDLIVGVQGTAREILEGARGGGVEDGRLTFVPDAVQAGELLARTGRGDVILVKGSRGVELEQAVNALRAGFPSEP